MRLLSLMLSVLLLGVAPSTAMAGPKSDARALRQLPAGPVVGFADKQDTYGWLGIPYAQPPVGPLRWRAPLPAVPWKTPLEAITPGNICPQLGNFLSGDSVTSSMKVTGNEDCLYLNVWTPRIDPEAAQASGKRLPVMVWLHGGGNSIGTANTYEIGRNLAGKYGVVFVALNYRLGVLGWFHHPALHEEGSSAEDRSGNFGTLDQLQALRWVQQNIAAFGGDPQNVTLFGESAGGIDTFALLMSPLGRGLFQRAIVESGVPSSIPFSQGLNFQDDPQPGEPGSSSELLSGLLVGDQLAADRRAARQVLASMRSEDIRAYLRSKNPEELLERFKGTKLGMYRSPQLFRDGVVLPLEAPEVVLADPTKVAPVPVMMGTNRDEMKLFLSFNPELVHWRLGVFPRVKDSARYERITGYLSRLWKVAGVDRPATLLSGRPELPVFVYRFDWDEATSSRLANLHELFGAAHGFEIPFVFRDLEGELNKVDLWTRKNKAGRIPLAEAMSSYWAEFAYHGAPGRGRDGTLPEWSAFTPTGADTPRLMIFDSAADGGVRMSPLLLTVDGLKAQLKTDPALKGDPKALCEQYVWMFGGAIGRLAGLWNPEEYRTLGTTGCEAYPAEQVRKLF